MSMAATIGFGTIFAGGPVSAASLSELNQQSKELQGKQSEVDQKLNQTTERIGEIQEEQNSIRDEIKRIELEINDTNTKIAEKNQQIEDKNKEIEQLKTEIVDLQNRIEVRNELLKDRARSYQEGGGVVNYLEVLVGAKSFGDFIDRIGAVATIVEADQTIITEHIADKNELEEKKAAVESELAQLKTMQQELESLKATLNGQKEEQNNLMAMLEQEKVEAEGEQISLEEEKAALQHQEAAVQKAIELEKQRQAELKRQQEEEAKRQREEAAKRKQAEAAKQTQQQASSTKAPESNNSSSTNTGVSVSSSAFIRPAQGYMSSNFGYRTHPVTGERTSYHSGLDIAKAGTVPVVASADGVVTYSGPMGTYGNVIMITHSINGQTYQTLYAHLRSLGVSAMQTVSQGQFIGYMGNTGRSTGQHLHFEVHKGTWNGSRSNAINPLSVL